MQEIDKKEDKNDPDAYQRFRHCRYFGKHRRLSNQKAPTTDGVPNHKRNGIWHTVHSARRLYRCDDEFYRLPAKHSIFTVGKKEPEYNTAANHLQPVILRICLSHARWDKKRPDRLSKGDFDRRLRNRESVFRPCYNPGFVHNLAYL